jgi:hypothetical protein
MLGKDERGEYGGERADRQKRFHGFPSLAENRRSIAPL